MIYFRSVFFLVACIFVTIFYGIFTVPLAILVHDVGYECARSWGRQILRLAKYVCGIDYEIRGLGNIPARPCVVMAKHQSAWETVAILVTMPQSAWIIKRELLMLPIVGWVLGGLQSIAIDRKSGKTARDQILEQGRDRLARGYGVVIFPEGTRVEPGKRGRYGVGGAWLAAGTGAPILPVAHNAGECWRRNAFLKYPGKVTMSIGPVIETADKESVAILKQTENWIENEMARLPPAAA
jgi:1-acyl-sn-glycerol-3-phosphate acyltransferase